MRDVNRARQVFDTMRPAMLDAVASFQKLEPVIRAAEEPSRIVHRVGLQEALPIFRKRGWFGIERHLDPLELHKVIELHRKQGGIAVDRYLCRRFGANRQARLREMTKEWAPVSYIAARRRKILLALRAHARREFALSIPLLLTFSDGVSAAYFRSNPSKVQTRTGQRKPTVLVGEVAGLYRTGHADYASLVAEAISRHLYKAYDFGLAPPAALNRHGILHGDILDFDSESNSLKAWLLLDALCVVALRGPAVP